MPSLPCRQSGQRQLKHRLGLLVYEVEGRLRLRNIVPLQVGSESFAPQNESLPVHIFRNECNTLRRSHPPTFLGDFQRFFVAHCDKQFVYIFRKDMQLCLAAHPLDCKAEDTIGSLSVPHASVSNKEPELPSSSQRTVSPFPFCVFLSSNWAAQHRLNMRPPMRSRGNKVRKQPA